MTLRSQVKVNAVTQPCIQDINLVIKPFGNLFSRHPLAKRAEVHQWPKNPFPVITEC